MAIAGRITIVLLTLAHILPRFMGVVLSYRALAVRTEMPVRLVAVMSAALLFRVAFWARSRVKQLRAAPKAVVIDQSGQTESIDAAVEHQLKSLSSPPVLYLRPFHVDPSVEPSRLGHHQTVEEGLLEALAPIGPSVALGCPGETQAFPGAIRLYCGQGNWRRCVERLVDTCALCVIVAGNTQSLHWEIDYCVARLPPCRLLICFARSRFTEERQEFLRSMSELFPLGLPVISPDTVFICFEKGWVPRCLSYEAAPLWFRMERASSGPLRAYQSILTPVFSGLHIKFTPPSAVPFMAFLAVSAVLLVWVFAVEFSLHELVIVVSPLAGLVLLTSDWRRVLTGRA